MTDTTPIITISSIPIEVAATQELTVSQEGYTSSIPPWLISQVSKHKKQMISPNEVDLEEIVPPKAKGKKKENFHSRLHIDKSGHKYVDISLPPHEQGDVNMEDYTITRFQLGKVTNASEKEDAQVVLNALLGRLDKMEQARNMYKDKVERYALVLRKIAGSSENVQPMAMVNVEEPANNKSSTLNTSMWLLPLPLREVLRSSLLLVKVLQK